MICVLYYIVTSFNADVNSESNESDSVVERCCVLLKLLLQHNR